MEQKVKCAPINSKAPKGFWRAFGPAGHLNQGPPFRTATQRPPERHRRMHLTKNNISQLGRRKAPLRKAYLTGWVAWSAQFEIVGRQKGQRARWRSPEPRVRHGDVAHSGFHNRMQRCTKLADVFTMDCFISTSFSDFQYTTFFGEKKLQLSQTWYAAVTAVPMVPAVFAMSVRLMNLQGGYE